MAVKLVGHHGQARVKLVTKVVFVPLALCSVVRIIRFSTDQLQPQPFLGQLLFEESSLTRKQLHARDPKRLPDGFIVIKDGDDKLQEDLEKCFSPLRSNENWPNTTEGFTCHLGGIGSFRITKCMRRHASKFDTDNMCFVESLDEEDYGTPYFMKMNPPAALRPEAEVVHYLSNDERSKNHTAKSHPRYPYLEWKFTEKKNDKKHTVAVTNRTVAVTFMEQLSFTPINTHLRSLNTVDKILSKQTTQCWRDVMGVFEALWDYRGGHYLHNDIHGGQVLVGTGGDNGDGEVVLWCHVIDFGLVISLDNLHGDAPVRLPFSNPFWYTQMQNETQRTEYIHEHGIEEFYKRGRELSLSRWGHLVFLRRLIKVMYGVKMPLFKRAEIEERKKDTGYDEYAVIIDGLCQTSEIVRKLVEKLEKWPKKLPAMDDDAFRMVLEQSTIIGSSVSVLNCSGYETVLTE